jgi:tetraacyldisaccharide 4'-kinase
MSADHGQSILSVMSGQRRGPGAATLRALLACAEVPYSAAAAVRNRLYDAGTLATHALPRPVISVGNITVGGTGKTPMVAWLADHLRQLGRRPAILLRGYKAGGGLPSDEQQFLDASLNRGGSPIRIPVLADADRLAGAAAVLREHPQTDLFILDDGFQHRRVARDFDLVLINAAEPFGFGHVLPRGLLREPVSGLRRAHAIVLTRTDQSSPHDVSRIEAQVRRSNATAPFYRARHVQTGLLGAGEPLGASVGQPLGTLRGRRTFTLLGLGDPQSVQHQIDAAGALPAGRWWPADHHRYTAADLARVRSAARDAGADLILTTEKDWARLAVLPEARDGSPPIVRVAMRMALDDSGEKQLVDAILSRLRNQPTAS